MKAEDVGPEDVVVHVSKRLQALAQHWGHPAWSDSWGEQVAREALVAAHEIAPSIYVSDVNRDAVICNDCGGWPKPNCDVAGHGLTTLDDLIDTYSGD